MFLLLVIILTAASCNPTKYVPSGEMLLNKNNLVIRETEELLPPTVSKKELKPYVKQQPNKRIFGARFYLGLYNVSDIEKEKWPHDWLRRIGEEPVIFDPVAATRTAEQIKRYMWSKGFFNASVTDSVSMEKKEAVVDYRITPGKPYTVADIRYEIQDTVLYGHIMYDTMSCRIKRGMIYDVDLLQSERSRLERYIRNIGYYAFSTEDIYFRIDSSQLDYQVIVYYVVSRKSSLDRNGRLVYSNHDKFRINDIYVFPDFEPRLALTEGDQYFRSFDTAFYKGVYYVSPPGKYLIKPEVLGQWLYVSPGSLYSMEKTEQTQSRLAAMKTHRLVNVTYVDAGRGTTDRRTEGMLDCIVQLTPMQRQSFTVELEGSTNTGGNVGGALNFIYDNKSLFGGAEQFSLKLKGSYEYLFKDIKGLKSTWEYGLESSLRLPRFLVPYSPKESFVRSHDPKTVLMGGYNHQRVPAYTREMANITVGYSWNGNRFTKHNINPLSFTFVNLSDVDSVFQQEINEKPYLAYSYRDVLIMGAGYNLVFNNQVIPKQKDYWNIRLGFDIAGNLLNLIYSAAGIPKDTIRLNDNARDTFDLAYQLREVPFAQYIKGEVDASYHYRINDASSVVYRIFAGLGVPYGNSGKAMPFEEQYFNTSSNDVRAWIVRTLGPGSYKSPDETGQSLINQTADIKIMANAEYRFRLFWAIEGAVFLDAGNIWTLWKDIDRPGSQFWTTETDESNPEGKVRLGKIFDDLALGTGFGLRLDLKFVLVRADIGFKLRNPQKPQDEMWRLFSKDFNRKDDTNIVIGIGYPF